MISMATLDVHNVQKITLKKTHFENAANPFFLITVTAIDEAGGEHKFKIFSNEETNIEWENDVVRTEVQA